MSKEIRLLIQERLKGFKPGIVQSDVDSFIFDVNTMLKIEELSKEFDMQLVIEVMQNKHYFANMTIDSIPAQREVRAYRDGYPVTNVSSKEEIIALSSEMCKLFDELVDSSPDNLYLVKDVDEWISRIDSMKEKYGYRPFSQMYEVISGIRKIMWTEGLPELEASVEYHDRREKEYRQDLHRSLERMNSYESSENILSQSVALQQLKEELDNGGLFLEPTTERQSHMKRSLMHGMAGALSLGSTMITTHQGSGGHGYDISTNGSRHKKVVTGKAGNQYPVVKRRGVR